MKIGLFGYGTVGSGVDDLIREENAPDVQIKKVLSRTVKDAFRDRAVQESTGITEDPEINTVAECIGGIHPAYEFITAAMNAGKNVVTSNKAVLAAYYKELTALAFEKKVCFRATASVGGGIPWLSTLECLLKSERLLSFSGIMNGTTNFILSKMEKGLREGNSVGFDSVLKEAQALGYAEADPSADIDGIDVRRKLCISMNIGFKAVFREEALPVFGIRNVKESDFIEAFGMGRTLRLMARASFLGATEETVQAAACVLPVLVKEGSPESAVSENFNLFTAETSRTGTLRFMGPGAGKYPTAENVVRDINAIRSGCSPFYVDRFRTGIPVSDGTPAVFYVRTVISCPYLDEITDKKLNNKAILTKPVSVGSFLYQMEKLFADDPGLFLALVD